MMNQNSQLLTATTCEEQEDIAIANKWIRLHNGVMPEGLDHMEMQLQKTKYYTFQAQQARPAIRELIYKTPSHLQPIASVQP